MAHQSDKEIPSIVKHLFYGEVTEEEVFPFPHLNDGQVEMAKAMIDAVDKYAQANIDSAKMDREAKIPKEEGSDMPVYEHKDDDYEKKLAAFKKMVGAK